MAQYQLPRGRSRPRALRITLLVVVVLAFIGARTIASILIDYEWWKELGQVDTWLSMYLYSVGPLTAATLVAFAALCWTHARALRFADARLGEHPTYAKLSTAALLLVAFIVSSASLDTWTVVRYAGSRHLGSDATAWQDPVFGRAARILFVRSAFLFRFAPISAGPYHRLHPGLLDRGARLAAAPSHGGAARDAGDRSRESSGWRAAWSRGFCAARWWWRWWRWRFDSSSAATRWLLNQHNFLVGADYVDNIIGLPLQWLLIAACLAAAVFVWMGRWVLAALHGAGAGGPVYRAGRGFRALRAAERDFARAAVHRDPHSRHAQRLRDRAAGPGN